MRVLDSPAAGIALLGYYRGASGLPAPSDALDLKHDRYQFRPIENFLQQPREILHGHFSNNHVVH